MTNSTAGDEFARLFKPGIAKWCLTPFPRTFYLSTPIGQERVEFNANWVFDPRSIVRCCESAGMTLQKLIAITPANGPQESAFDAVALDDLALQRYQLGLFIFKKEILYSKQK